MRKFEVAQILSSRAVKQILSHSKLKPYTVYKAEKQIRKKYDKSFTKVVGICMFCSFLISKARYHYIDPLKSLDRWLSASNATRLLYHPKHKDTKIFDDHLNPVMLVFTG